jgi:phage tail-like protein
MIGGQYADYIAGKLLPAKGSNEQVHPYVNFRFHVEIDGIIVAGFSEVLGLSSEIEVEEIREGGVNNYMHKFPKMTKYEDITLKRGFTNSDTLWKWHHNIAQLYTTLESLISVHRKSGRIILHDSQGKEIRHWVFKNALPIKWSGPDFKSDDSSIAIETLVLAHEGLDKFDLLDAIVSAITG